MKQVNSVKSALSDNIRKLREIRNFTQTYMAKQLDMTQGNYARLERGEITITENRLGKIAEILQFPKHDIVHFNTESLFERRLMRPIAEDLLSESQPSKAGLYQYTISPELKVLYESRIRQLEEYVQELKLRLGDRDGNNEGKESQ